VSIHLIAKDLYRLIREVDDLEKQIENAPPEKKQRLRDRLKSAKAQRDEIRKILDGHKE
jgi:hypothetical protein